MKSPKNFQTRDDWETYLQELFLPCKVQKKCDYKAFWENFWRWDKEKSSS